MWTFDKIQVEWSNLGNLNGTSQCMDVPKTRVVVAVVGQMVIQGTCTGHLNGQVVSMVLIRCVVSSREYTQTLMLH